MVKPIACPPKALLQDLIEGKINEPQLSVLSKHLEQCGRCQEKAKTLAPLDTLAESLRREAAAAQQLAETIPQPLVERLKNIARAELAFLAAPQQPDEIGRLGAYRILKVLGHGGMGLVFLAEDPELDRKVALKVMLPKIAANPVARQRFLREARAAAKLRNDHIVTIHQVSEDHGVPFLALELLEGQTLAGLLQAQPALAVPEILRIGREIAQGLATAHEKGLIHRDIKPANLWLDSAHGNRVKILDFGLARLAQDDAHLTQSGAIVGTPAYMAPEQARGDTNVDAHADLFALGCVLYQLCAGELPFKGASTMEVLTSLAVDTPAAPHEICPAIPQPLSELIMQLLEKDPGRRPVSARNVIARLLEIERTVSGNDPPSSSVPPVPSTGTAATVSFASLRGQRQPRARRRNPWVRWIAVGFAALVFALLGVILYIVTDDGTVEIRTDDKTIKVIVEEDGGKVRILDPTSTQTWTLHTGKYTIRLEGNPDGLEIALPRDRAFEMKRGDKLVVSIRKLEKPVLAAKEATFTNALGMKFALVPKGKGWLGGKGGIPGDKVVEFPSNFYIGVYSVTQEEWVKVMGSNPCYFARTGGGKELVKTIPEGELKRFPVESVDWNDCQKFVARLNEQAREQGWKYRLPTEAEWEYACRGGPLLNKADFGFDFYADGPSNQLPPDHANFGNSGWKRPTRVGMYQPNRLGLYDMHGNVWNWCDDALTDGQGNPKRAIRGGGWCDVTGNCRAAFRVLLPPSYEDSFHNLGLRLVCVAAPIKS
jgi:serine/threonine protein kinase/formylglycine-generating enzyme required for sulfatase activity